MAATIKLYTIKNVLYDRGRAMRIYEVTDSDNRVVSISTKFRYNFEYINNEYFSNILKRKNIRNNGKESI